MMVLVAMKTFYSGLQLQMQVNSQQSFQLTGAKQVSAKLSGADQVSKATKVLPTGRKRGSSESKVPKAKVRVVM